MILWLDEPRFGDGDGEGRAMLMPAGPRQPLPPGHLAGLVRELAAGDGPVPGRGRGSRRSCAPAAVITSWPARPGSRRSHRAHPRRPLRGRPARRPLAGLLMVLSASAAELF